MLICNTQQVPALEIEKALIIDTANSISLRRLATTQKRNVLKDKTIAASMYKEMASHKNKGSQQLECIKTLE